MRTRSTHMPPGPYPLALVWGAVTLWGGGGGGVFPLQKLRKGEQEMVREGGRGGGIR
jgi:hypothetical protein